MRSCVAWLTFAAHQVAQQRFGENVVHQRTLAGAARAGDAHERAERDFDVDVLEVVVTGADDAERGTRNEERGRNRCAFLAPRSSLLDPSLLRHLDLPFAREKRSRHAARLAGDFVRRAGGDDFAAAHARAGAEVDEVIGRPHRVFVVLDDDDRVAQVAQLGERVEQPLVVARMQADRRLVENVQHADQAAADLPGQANALRFAAGKRRRRAVEREIVEPDILQEAEPAADFLEHFGGDQLLVAFELELARKTRPRRKRPARTPRAASVAAGRQSCGLAVVDRHRAGLRVEPLAGAIGAADHAHVLFELANLRRALAGAVLFQQLGNEAVERAAVFLRPPCRPATCT